MDNEQIVKVLRRIAGWLEDDDVIEARADLKHLLDTIDPAYVEETMVDRLFKDMAQALRPADIGGG